MERNIEKILVLYLMALLPLLSLGQSGHNPRDTTSGRILSLGIYGSPNYAKPTFNIEGGMPSGDTRSGDWRYGFGLFLKYDFSSHLGLNGEISYDHLQYHYLHTNQFPSGPVTVPHNFKFDFINIPIGIHYYIGSNKVYGLVSVSVQPSFLLDNEYSSGSVDPYVMQLYDDWSVSVFGKFQGEVGFGLSKKISVIVNANYHVAFVPLRYTYITPYEQITKKNYLEYYKIALGIRYFFNSN